MPGVRAIFHRGNIGKIFRSTLGPGSSNGSAIERRPPFEDDVIRYYGQYIALAVADTFESAKAAADAVALRYTEGETQRRILISTRMMTPTWLRPLRGPAKRLQSERGDA